MILYVNGDSHTAAAEATNPHAFAEDDGKYFYQGRSPHPDNLAVSWGKQLSDILHAGFHCDAESASSNDRILRTSKKWIEEVYPSFNDEGLVIIQWSTWEREEWLIDGTYYQINASGIDSVPESHQQKYKEFVDTVNWQEKTKQAHEDIWNFHLYLLEKNISHIFFNGNTSFKTIKNRQDWGVHYMHPYDEDKTFDSVLKNSGHFTVSPKSWHYDKSAHSTWAKYMLQYILDNNLV